VPVIKPVLKPVLRTITDGGFFTDTGVYERGEDE